jgi:hypothetical protein
VTVTVTTLYDPLDLVEQCMNVLAPDRFNGAWAASQHCPSENGLARRQHDLEGETIRCDRF